MTEINHLDGIESRFVETERLRMHVLTAGNQTKSPILFLHGNTCSATIWEEFMLQFAEGFYCVAPDLRGFGQTDDRAIIDATRGMHDWVDDLRALTKKLGLATYHLIGHSLGGFVCWGMIGRCAEQLRSVSLIAPGSPMGFGGIHGRGGCPNNEDYSGSGGGIVVDAFAERLAKGDRSAEDPFYSPRNAMNRLFWKEGFTANREEDILTAMLNIHTGDKKYPGDWVDTEYWPGVAPGKYGPVNALSPKYNQNVKSRLLRAEPKPPLLWVQGKDDNIISDQSYSDPGFQGKLGLRDGWPGEDHFPPQPMISQIEQVLKTYQTKGGTVITKWVDDCGHTPFLEHPTITGQTVLKHIKEYN